VKAANISRGLIMLHRRRKEMESIYKRVKHVLVEDPHITATQLRERFRIGYAKISELRKEVEHEAKVERDTP
jgi:hypothetical protein